MHALKKNHEIACYKNSNAKTSVYIYGKVNSIPFAINSIYLSYGLMGENEMERTWDVAYSNFLNSRDM